LFSCFFSVLCLEQPQISNLPTYVEVDYDIIPEQPTKDLNLYRYNLTGSYNSTGRPYKAYLATFPASRFSFYPSYENGCLELIKTSESSFTTYTCEYATNGAFFKFDLNGTDSLCIGNLISNGKTWQLPTDGTGTKRANFGITKTGDIVTGFLDENDISSLEFNELITGWGWIVRGGVSNVNSSKDLPTGGFTLEKAPRTAVGVFKNSSVALLEIDGEEDIQAGPDLFEIAELFVSVGIESAINIDGGGSSVSVYKGKVISEPTCQDTPVICERAVASITCVRT